MADFDMTIIQLYRVYRFTKTKEPTLIETYNSYIEVREWIKNNYPDWKKTKITKNISNIRGFF